MTIVFRTTAIYHQVSTKYSMFSTTQSLWAKQSKEIHRQIPALVRITNGMGAQLTHMQAPDPDSPHTHNPSPYKKQNPQPHDPQAQLSLHSTLLRSHYQKKPPPNIHTLLLHRNAPHHPLPKTKPPHHLSPKTKTQTQTHQYCSRHHGRRRRRLFFQRRRQRHRPSVLLEAARRALRHLLAMVPSAVHRARLQQQSCLHVQHR